MNIPHKLLQLGLKKTILGYALFTAIALLVAYFLKASQETLLLILFMTGSNAFVFLFLAVLYLKQNLHVRDTINPIGTNQFTALNQLESRINTHTTETLFWNVNQLEASHYLQSFISPRIPLPNTRQGAASPDLLSTIFQKIILNDPKTIVELGSGVSTLFMGHLLRDRKMRGKIHSVDHSEEYFKITEENILNAGLTNEVTLYYCPLIKYVMKEKECLWYDISGLTVSSIDLLIIDGPPGFLQEKMRYPALPLLIDRLAEGALIIVDDYKRYDDSEMVKEWLSENSELKLIAEINSEKGTAIIQKVSK